jgi:hypothetical protein
MLQDSLDTLSNYCTQFQLNLNTDKCYHITFSRQVPNLIPTSFSVSDVSLTKVSSVKDLGVHLDSRLTFNIHRKHCYNKALKMLGFLFRTCKDFRNVNSLKIIYFSYVRSHLEYCSQVWNPTKITYSAELEKIQRKFVRFLYFKNLIPNNSPFTDASTLHTGYSYSSSLNDLCLQSLNDRRKFFDVDLILKTFTNRIDSTSFIDFFRFPNQSRSLRHRSSFLTSVTKESTIERCMKAFNGLKINLNSLCHEPYAHVRSKALGILRDQSFGPR